MFVVYKWLTVFVESFPRSSLYCWLCMEWMSNVWYLIIQSKPLERTPLEKSRFKFWVFTPSAVVLTSSFSYRGVCDTAWCWSSLECPFRTAGEHSRLCACSSVCVIQCRLMKRRVHRRPDKAHTARGPWYAAFPEKVIETQTDGQTDSTRARLWGL